MKQTKKRSAIVTAVVTCLAGTWLFAEPVGQNYWPQWRGPNGNGVSLNADPPIKWSEEENIRWKLKLPGLGHSSPVVWREHVYLTAAVPYGEKTASVVSKAEGAHDNYGVEQHHRFVVIAVRRDDGRIVWQKTVRSEFPQEGGHFTGSLASNSPVTDGERLYAHFGSRGLYALNLTDGKVVWKKDLGRMQTRHAHGEGSSPALHGNTLVVNWDHEADSFLIAIDTQTGKQRWKVKREEMTSWSSPLVVEHEGEAQVIVSATGKVRSYDLVNGKLIWECGGLSRNVVASPVAGNGMVFVGNSYDWQAMLGIRLKGANGDITGSDNVVWTLRKLTPYVPSPLLCGDTLYFLRHNHNVLSMVNARTGEYRTPPARLGGLREIFASPVAASKRIYITDRSGSTIVISHEEQPILLATNHLKDSFSASPALCAGDIYLRGEKNLYCISRR